MAIGTTIKSIQDIMRKDAGVDGDAQRISQLVWMLFLKIFDDHEAEKEMLDDNYKSPIPMRLRWRTWAKDAEGITGRRAARLRQQRPLQDAQGAAEHRQERRASRAWSAASSRTPTTT